jgi:hypothetical protein
LPHISQEIPISKETWNKAIQLIKNRIIKKLSTAKQNIDIDTEIAAGIYIYALDEFGKLLLLKECQVVNGKYIIKFRDGFRSHSVKFKAFDHLQDNGSSECIVSNDGAFTSDAYSWRSYTIGLLEQTEARLGKFYVDFVQLENNEYDISEFANVDRDKLINAINKFEEFINTFVILFFCTYKYDISE